MAIREVDELPKIFIPGEKGAAFRIECPSDGDITKYSMSTTIGIQYSFLWQRARERFFDDIKKGNVVNFPKEFMLANR